MKYLFILFTFAVGNLNAQNDIGYMLPCLTFKNHNYSGSYCAEVSYFNTNSETSTYELNVEVCTDQLRLIKFPNGWLNESHFGEVSINSSGFALFSDKGGYQYSVKILNKGSCQTNNYQNYNSGVNPKNNDQISMGTFPNLNFNNKGLKNRYGSNIENSKTELTKFEPLVVDSRIAGLTTKDALEYISVINELNEMALQFRALNVDITNPRPGDKLEIEAATLYYNSFNYSQILKQRILNSIAPKENKNVFEEYLVRDSKIYYDSALYYLGKISERQDENIEIELARKAIEHSTHAIDLLNQLDEPNKIALTMCLTSRALAYLESKQYRKAIADFSDVIEVEEKNESIDFVYENRGYAFFYLGYYSQACDDFKVAFELNNTIQIKNDYLRYCN